MAKRVTLEELLLEELDASDDELDPPVGGDEQEDEDSSQAASRWPRRMGRAQGAQIQ